MKVFWGVIAAAAAITALIMAGTGVLMKDLDARHGNNTTKQEVRVVRHAVTYQTEVEPAAEMTVEPQA